MLNISPPPISASGRTFGTIARVQSKTATTGAASAGSVNLVFDSTPTAGNIIVLAIAVNGALADISATNINFSLIPRTGANLSFCMLAWGRVLAGASATITVDNNGSSNTSVVGAEYSGGSLLRLDMTTSAIGNSTSAASGATATTTTGPELWVGALSNRNTNGGVIFSSPTNSFSIVDQTNSSTAVANADRAAALLERIVTSTGAANAGATCSSNNWSAVAATFEETPLIFLNN